MTNVWRTIKSTLHWIFSGADSARSNDPSNRFQVIPVPFIDQAVVIRPSIINYTFQYQSRLDATKLHDALVALLHLDGWKKFGGRLRMNKSGSLEIHVPLTFSPTLPALRFSHVIHNVRAEDHPIGCQLPAKDSKWPSVQAGCRVLKDFSVPEDFPDRIDTYLTTDEPMLTLHVTSFLDGTIVSISHPHAVADAIGSSDLIRAWSCAVAGRFDEIAQVRGIQEDVLETVGTEADEKSIGPFALSARPMNVVTKLFFILRNVWELLTVKVSDHTVVLPKEFLSHLRRESLLERPAESGKPSPLSRADLVAGWFTHKILAARSRGRPAIIWNILDLRSCLTGVCQPGVAYLQNLILPSYVQIAPQEAAVDSSSDLAWRFRQTLHQQANDTQMRRLLRIMKGGQWPPNYPLFGQSNTCMIACTNWAKARMREAADFPAAVIGPGNASDCGEKSATLGRCSSYWGSTISRVDHPRNTIILYGEDGNENYCVQGFLEERAWRLITEELQRFSVKTE